MKTLTSSELKKLYFDYFKSLRHSLIPSASLIPENDPTVLFTTAGMHPLVPYLMGEKHPEGVRLVNAQKCVRTNDIDEVGDETHLTFFEMLGNWSLGDYFKEDAIKYSYEFLTSDKYLNIPKEKLYFTCFEGDSELPKDMVSYNAWINEGVDKSHIFFLDKTHNFWILGSGIGPCGPDTEIFFDTGREKCSEGCKPGCSCNKYVEIWNNVFIEYLMSEDKTLTKLKQQNVDTGMGLERTVAVLNGYDSIFETDLFDGLKKKINSLSNISYEEDKKNYRIIMDHIRSSVFILGDETPTKPSNVGSGYVLRRLIRRAIRSMINLGIDYTKITLLAEVVINDYKSDYPSLVKGEEFIKSELLKESEKFSKTLAGGEKLFRKITSKLGSNIISGIDAFKLFDTFGFPIEMTIELAKEKGLSVDMDGFNKSFELHKEKSKTLEKGVARGGLADDSYQTVKYHTLTHILLKTLQDLYGSNLIQRGANINSERVRFDFTLDRKMTPEEIKEVEEKVNEVINKNLDVTHVEVTLEEARSMNAHGAFSDKYGRVVKVYSIGDYSKEICGGPHVKNTSEIGKFKIIKEESVASGIRRIRGVLE